MSSSSSTDGPWRDSSSLHETNDEKEMSLMLLDAKINIQHILLISSYLILIEYILTASLSPLGENDKFVVYGFFYGFALYIIVYGVILLMNLFQPFLRLDASEESSSETEERLMKLRKILIEHIRLVFDLALIGVSILGSTLFFLLQTVFLLFSSTNGVYLSINILAGLWLLYVMLCKTKFDTQISLFLLAVISVSILSFIGKSQSDGIIKVAWIIPLLCFFTLLLFDISILLFTEKANNGAKIKLKVCQKESLILYLLGFTFLLCGFTLFMGTALSLNEYTLTELPSLPYNLVVITIWIGIALILFGTNIVIEEFLSAQLKAKGGKRPLSLKQQGNKGYDIDKETSHFDHFLVGQIETASSNMGIDSSKSRILSLLSDFFGDDEMCSCCKVLNCAMCCSTEMTLLEGENQHEA